MDTRTVIRVITAATSDDIYVGEGYDFDSLDDLAMQIQRNTNLMIRASGGRIIFGRHVVAVAPLIQFVRG